MKIAKIINTMKTFTNFTLPCQAYLLLGTGHSSHFVGCFTPSAQEKRRAGGLGPREFRDGSGYTGLSGGGVHCPEVN
jgi:hypothetical protein